MEVGRKSGMGLRRKLHIPNLFSVILLILVCVLYLKAGKQIGVLNQQQEYAHDLGSRLRTFGVHTQSFLNGELPLEELDPEYKQLKGMIVESRVAEDTEALEGELVRFRDLSRANQEMESNLDALTEASAKLSNDYIKMVSQKLAGEDTRSQVTPLECLVLIGANTNTVSNYEVKVRFLKLKESIKNKDALLDFVKTLLANVEKDIQSLTGTPFQGMAMTAKENNLKIQGIVSSYIKNIEEQNGLRKSINDRTNRWRQSLGDGAAKSAGELLGSLSSGLRLILGALSAFCFFGIGFGLLLSRSISRSLLQVIGGLRHTSERVSTASEIVSDSSRQLAKGSSEQAAAVEETSASLEEMSSMTKRNAQNASEANSLMRETSQVVTEANASMAELTSSMHEISTASEDTQKIIKTIDEIAFQTNLLALNAAVEAARAGEAGAGFAVVADEVRSLALRAAEAARNTATLIEGTVKKIRTGSELVTKASGAFGKVADGARKIGELIDEINEASREQAQGIDQISKAVSQMDEVTQENAANAQESAAASEEMNAQAEEMKGFVRNLVVLEGSAMEERATSPAGSASKALIPSGGGRSGKPEKRARSTGSRGGEVSPDQVVELPGRDFEEF